MNWPDLQTAAKKPWFTRIADGLPDDFNESQRATLLLWCIHRFNPANISADKQVDDMDEESARHVGISNGSSLYPMIFPEYHPVLASLIIDVLDCFGDAEYKRFEASKIYIRMAYNEVMAPLKETDEDKRAAVILKKGEVLKSLITTEKDVQQLSDKIFGASDRAKLAGLSQVLTPEARAKVKSKRI